MTTFLFQTETTMKPYNNTKWYIVRDFIPNKFIAAPSLADAIEKWRKTISEDCCVQISDNAIKTKEPMFIDTESGAKQTGYVFTAKTDLQDSHDRWSSQYIELWTTILTITDTKF